MELSRNLRIGSTELPASIPATTFERRDANDAGSAVRRRKGVAVVRQPRVAQQIKNNRSGKRVIPVASVDYWNRLMAGLFFASEFTDRQRRCRRLADRFGFIPKLRRERSRMARLVQQWDAFDASGKNREIARHD